MTGDWLTYRFPLIIGVIISAVIITGELSFWTSCLFIMFCNLVGSKTQEYCLKKKEKGDL